MFAIKSLLLFVAAAAALPAAVQDKSAADAFDSLQQDIAKIHDKATKIIRDMPSCGSIWCASKLKGQADDIKDTLEETTRDLTFSGSGKFSDNEAKRIVTMLDGTLEKDLTGVLHGVEKHEKLRGLQSRVRPYLEELKTTITGFGNALARTVPRDFEGRVRKEVEEMEAEAEQAIGVYSGGED